jgi:hypothetical protein
MATILAIDLGKYKSVICRLDTDTGEASFEKVTTTPREIGRLLERRRPDMVVIEACLLAGWVHDRCGCQGNPEGDNGGTTTPGVGTTNVGGGSSRSCGGRLHLPVPFFPLRSPDLREETGGGKMVKKRGGKGHGLRHLLLPSTRLHSRLS